MSASKLTISRITKSTDMRSGLQEHTSEQMKSKHMDSSHYDPHKSKTDIDH